MISREQFEKLAKYEQHLYTAVYGDYARNVTMEGFQVLDAVYKEVFGRDGGMTSGCGRCRLRGLKDLGRLYYEYLNTVKEEEAIDNQTVKESEPEGQVIENKAVKKTKATNKKNGK
jgi:hypothetical protein